MYNVRLRVTKLLDGSPIYDVVLELPEHEVVFYAADWAEAEDIADALKPVESVGVYSR